MAVVGILGDIPMVGTRYQKSVATAKKDETSAVNFKTPEIWASSGRSITAIEARAGVCGEAKEDYHDQEGAIDIRKPHEPQ
jgi:hypothetical protein